MPGGSNGAVFLFLERGRLRKSESPDVRVYSKFEPCGPNEPLSQRIAAPPPIVTAKTETRISTKGLELRKGALNRQGRTAISDSIECFYNPKRLHCSLNFLSPVDFETKNN